MRASFDIIDEQENQQAPIQDMAEDNPARRNGWRIGWELTESAWEKLRVRIENDPKLEGNDFEEKYKSLCKGVKRRFALTKLFEDDGVDETVNRVAKAIDGGVSIDNLPAYCNRIAYNVLIDFVEDPLNRVDEIDDTIDPPSPPPPDPLKEQRAECLEECLKKRPEEERELILKYYRDSKSKQREEIAKDLMIDINALRKRAQRIRNTLEKCILDCLKKSGLDVMNR